MGQLCKHYSRLSLSEKNEGGDKRLKKLVFHFIAYIPKRKVTTYKIISQVLDIENPRLVGKILHHNPNPEKYPCHRVVKSDGTIATGYAFGGKKVQVRKLREEKIDWNKNKVNLKKCLWRPNKIFRLYFNLLRTYGFPDRWPWFEKANKPHSPEKIIIGAILTQNTSWKNVEKALGNLEEQGINTLNDVYILGKQNFNRLKTLIKPARFYNQKALYLLKFSQSVLKINGLKKLKTLSLPQIRRFLLTQKGVGQETADTIILYGLEKPVFVIDAYTKRLVRTYNLTNENSYNRLQLFFQSQLPNSVEIFQNYHALIVRWGQWKQTSKRLI